MTEAAFDEAVEAFLLDSAHSQASDATHRSYRTALTRFFEAADVSTLKEALQLKECAKVLRTLERRYAPATVAQAMSAARQFYKWLSIDDPAIADPTKGLNVRVPDNTPDWNVLHPGAPAKMLAEIEEPHARAVFTALVLQGWRVSELCGMTWKQVRREGEHWVVAWRAKRNKQRTQRLQPTVLAAIEALQGKRSADAPVIPQPDGRPYTRGQIYQLVRRHSAKVGTPVTPHGLRATYISSVIRRKGIETARQLAGHKSISTTQRYSRWDVDSDDELTVEDL